MDKKTYAKKTIHSLDSFITNNIYSSIVISFILGAAIVNFAMYLLGWKVVYNLREWLVVIADFAQVLIMILAVIAFIAPNIKKRIDEKSKLKRKIMSRLTEWFSKSYLSDMTNANLSIETIDEIGTSNDDSDLVLLRYYIEDIIDSENKLSKEEISELKETNKLLVKCRLIIGKESEEQILLQRIVRSALAVEELRKGVGKFYERNRLKTEKVKMETIRKLKIKLEKFDLELNLVANYINNIRLK